MPENDKIVKFTTKMLKRMFSMVGATYSQNATSSPDWYLKYTWTPEQEATFKEYYIKVARKDLRWSLKYAKIQAGYFLLHCGWKTEDALCYAVTFPGEAPIAFGVSAIAAWNAAEEYTGETTKNLQKNGVRLIDGNWNPKSIK